MKNLIKDLTRDKVTFSLFIISFLFFVLTFIIIILSFKNLPPFIPIFNQLPWGNGRLTPTLGIFIPMILFFIVFILNCIFSLFLYFKNNPLLGRIIASITLLLSILNLLFIIRTIILVV